MEARHRPGTLFRVVSVLVFLTALAAPSPAMQLPRVAHFPIFISSMALKRKRADSFSSAVSNAGSSTPSSSRDQSSSPPVHLYRHQYSYPSPSDLNSRTVKRYRDNRPDEDVIHSMTRLHCTIFAVIMLTFSHRQYLPEAICGSQVATTSTHIPTGAYNRSETKCL